jgi:hypothetical protein
LTSAHVDLKGAQDARRSTPRHGCRVGEHTACEEKGVSLVTFFAPAKKDSLAQRVKALSFGQQIKSKSWIPA